MKKLLSAGLALLFALTSVFSVLAAPPVPPVRAPAASGSNAMDLDDLMSGRLPVASGSDTDSIPYSSLGRFLLSLIDCWRPPANGPRFCVIGMKNRP